MAITTSRTKDEFTALVDASLEVAIATCMNTTLPANTPGGATRKVTRAQVVKAIARRALRKGTQGAMRPEMGTNPPVTPGA